jgi:hypothetical protein
MSNSFVMMLFLMNDYNEDIINEMIRYENFISAQHYTQQTTLLKVWHVALLWSRTFVA